MSAQNTIRNILRAWLIFATVFTFVQVPVASFGTVDIYFFDLAVVFICILLPIYLISDSKIIIPRHRLLWITSFGYFSLAIGLPVAGLIVYNNPIGYFVGDLRWIQIAVLCVGALSLYSQFVEGLIHDLEIAVAILLILHFLFFAVQYVDYTGIADTSIILKFWYANQSAYGGTGYHIGRYAGASTNPSTLGLSAAVAIAIYGRALLVDRRGVGYLAIAALLLLASGNRTSMVAVAGITALLIVYRLRNIASLDIPVKHIMYTISSLVSIAVVVYHYNIGRFGSPDRYIELLQLIISPSHFIKISGRGDQWKAAVEQAQTYQFGTLSNPAWVFQDPGTIDSYFLLTFIQGDVLFLGVYILFLCSVFVVALRTLAHSINTFIPISFAVIITTSSLTQNFMTGLPGKLITAFILVILACIWMSMQHQVN